MTWKVLLHPDFEDELAQYPAAVQNEIAFASRLVGSAGPFLGRPHASFGFQFAASHGVLPTRSMHLGMPFFWSLPASRESAKSFFTNA